MNEMYHDRAAEYAAAIKDNIYNSLYDRPSLLDLVNSERYDNCLDMGCGPGAYIGELKEFCQRITAIDLSSKFVDIVGKEFSDVNSYVCDIAGGLKREQDSSFDLVISPLTIHYLPDLNYVFSEVSRVLQSGGVFAFSTHHPHLDFQDSESGNYFEKEKLTQMWDTLGGETGDLTR